MGLTLNTNSLTLASSGGGASGVSTSDVTTLIKGNTPYQFIAKLTADSSSTLEYTSLPSTFRSFRILLDGLTPNQNMYLRMQFYLDGTLETGSYYRFGGVERSNTSVNRYNTTQDSFYLIHNYEAGSGYPIIGFFEFMGNEANYRPQFYSTLVWQQGANIRQHRFGGHYNGGLNNLITGFKLYPSGGNFMRGSIKIYGMN